MRKESLQFLSLTISSLVILYLLFINILRNTFVISDWTVVIIDLAVKLIIEIYIIIERK